MSSLCRSGFCSALVASIRNRLAKFLVRLVNFLLGYGALRHHKGPVLLRDAATEPRIDRLLSNRPMQQNLAALVQARGTAPASYDCPYIFPVAHDANHASLNISELQAEKFGHTLRRGSCSLRSYEMVGTSRRNY